MIQLKNNITYLLILILFGGYMNVIAQDFNSDFTKYNLNDITIMVPNKLKIRYDYKFEKATTNGKLEEIKIEQEAFGETVTPNNRYSNLCNVRYNPSTYHNSDRSDWFWNIPPANSDWDSWESICYS